MRLFTKIALTLAATGFVATAASTLAIAVAFVPQYLEMDRNAALTNAERVHEALHGELDALAASVGDWGHWDDVFEFAKDHNKAFIRANLKQDDLATINVDELAIAAPDRRIGFRVRADRAAAARPGPFAGLKEVPARHWPVFSGRDMRETRVGFAPTPSGPALIATTAITDSNLEGPSPGVLLFARLVDGEFLKAVRDKTRLAFTLTPPGAPPGAAPAAHAATTANGVPVALAEHDDLIEASVALNDVSGAPSFTLRVATPTRFEQLAMRTLWITLGLLVVIGTVAVAVFAVFMRRAVTGPLERIIAHTQAISSTGDLAKKLALARDDEIGALADAFDGMIADLRQARLQLQEQSFVSGMANVAAEMMHNIRNALSPVATAIWKGRESLKEIRTDRLAQAGDAMLSEGLEAERKAKLAEYVNASARHIAERCRAAQDEFETIHGFTNQIELVLKHHEDLSRGVRHIESVSLAEVVASAAKLVEQSPLAIELSIAPALARMPAVSAQRVVLLQVLGNLLVNAVQSIERAKASPGRIAFDAVDRGATVELSVADNGEGIPGERMASLFRRGFTSREGEGKGLGLHYCATSLNAMNATIEADSAGLGHGARFRIVLPASAKTEKAA